MRIFKGDDNMGIVCGKGINDMPYGWTKANDKNQKIYQTWHSMLVRCYDEKYQERKPTYKWCSVCQRWLLLSNFIEDLHKIDGYNEMKFLNGELQLDKDIKSNGNNKEYSLENCMFVSKSENTKQMLKTRDNNYLQGENNPFYGKIGENNPHSVQIAQYDKKGNLITIWNGSYEIQREMGIKNQNIIACCKWYACGEDLNEWHKIRKGSPNKSAGGFIWKYLEEEK